MHTRDITDGRMKTHMHGRTDDMKTCLWHCLTVVEA